MERPSHRAGIGREHPRPAVQAPASRHRASGSRTRRSSSSTVLVLRREPVQDALEAAAQDVPSPTFVHRLASALPVLAITIKACLLEPEPRSIRSAGEDEGHDGGAPVAHPRIRKSVRWLHLEDLTLDPAAPALGVRIDKAVAGADLRPETFHHGAIDERPLRDRVPIGERLPNDVDGMRILDFLNDRVSRCLDHLFPPFWSCRGAVEVATQPPQSLLPKLFVLVQPVADLNQPIWAKHVTVGSPVPVAFDETSSERDAQRL